jgi:hypothetical protein
LGGYYDQKKTAGFIIKGKLLRSDYNLGNTALLLTQNKNFKISFLLD